MAEKKQHTIVAADGGEVKIKEAKPVGNATGLRVGAIVLWVAAIAFEVLAFCVLQGKVGIASIPTKWQLIGAIVLDLVCVIIGSQLWKKANHIRPASKKNALKFWLWNNLGVIVAIIAFVPLIILLLRNKDLDKKTKAICVAVAAIALIIGGLASYDFNPVSVEEQQTAIAAIDGTVYWAPFGHVYHTHEDCSALNRTDTLTAGDVEQAIAANRTRLCKFCANRDEITDVRTDEE